MVTIQIFRILNKCWFKSGMDLKMRIYDVLPTATQEGFVEVVPGVTSMGEIHALSGLTGSFNPSSILDWLKKQNQTRKFYDKSILNFILSCAGYCVATYILGICDRHNDNILLTKNGYIFHIDFNKYMGDAQMFLGIKRDRAPFVLTPDMMTVINEYNNSSGEGFSLFVDKCCVAYQIARRNSTYIFNTVCLLLGSDENFDSCIEYLYDRLMLEITDNDAYMAFYKLIAKSKDTLFTQFNFFMHNIAQKRITKPESQESIQSLGFFQFCNQKEMYSVESDGELLKITAVDYINKKPSHRQNTTYFIFKVERVNSDNHFIQRSLADIFELFHAIEGDKLNMRMVEFRKLKNIRFNSHNYVKKSHVCGALYDINSFIKVLLASPIKNSSILYAWCHPLCEDDKLVSTETTIFYPEPSDNQPAKVKITFEKKSERFSLLLMNIQNIRQLNVTTDCEFVVELRTYPSEFKMVSKKKVSTSDSVFLQKFEFPYTTLSFEKYITLYFKTCKFMSSKIFGSVNIKISQIDYSLTEGSWYIIDSIL
ncbi:hypothetical protein HZS_2778 [Henneguya salminicola]|nr:hypothetical protein HZS_2778 [Henneguya salminicola]